jgi:single-strand DNA-binding protein
MADLNHVVLLGRLTRDAELKYTAGGQAVCKFSIAVNRRRKNGDQWEDEANFFDVVVWGRQGESLNQYLIKGKMVGVDGELRQDRWQQDGQNRSKVEIVANYLQLLGGSGSGGNSGGSGSSSGGSGSGAGNSFGNGSGNSGGGQNWQAPSPSGGDEGPNDSFADDIPF